MDIQIVVDHFEIITYVTDYWAKPDEGLTPILREAAKQLKTEPEQKKRAQEMANTFISHRQMGEAEAYYKILPNLTLKYSNVDTVFVPTDKKEMRSRFLMKIDDTDGNGSIGTTVKGGRDGKFIEKRDIIDKYCERDLDLKENLKELCLSQFAKMYEPINSRTFNVDDEERFSSVPIHSEQNHVSPDDYEIVNYIITANPKVKNLSLPERIRIMNPLPGEVSIWKKRSFPKAMRIHKKKQDTEPVKYFLSEMLLYTPFLDERELGSNDDQKCIELYFKLEENIQQVKGKIMPFISGIEEARHYMNEAGKQCDASIGDILDPQNEQEDCECFDIEETPHPDFIHLDPNTIISEEKNLQKLRNSLVQFKPRSQDEMLMDARRLDEYQKKGFEYCNQICTRPCNF